MGRLLSIEWMKLKNYRTFWVLLCMYIATVFGANYIAYRIQQSIYAQKQAKGMASLLLGNPPYSFPSVWQATAHISSYLLFIPGLILIIFVTNEYSYKTHRQNIIDGLTRKQFIVAKILMAATLALISTCLVVLTAFIFGMIDGTNALSFEGFHYIGYYLLEAMSYIMVALLMAIFFKRGGLSIGVFFAYSLILEEIVVLLLNKYTNYFGRYLPLETNDILTPFPRVDQIINRLTSNTPDYTTFFILALIYLAAYLFIAIRKLETDDL